MRSRRGIGAAWSRVALLAVVAVGGCDDPRRDSPRASAAPSSKPKTQTIELPGVKMQVPAEFVKFDPDGQSPSKSPGEPGVVAVRSPRGLAFGGMQVQRHQFALNPIDGLHTVREALDAQATVMKKMFSEPPAKLERFEVTEESGALKVCAVARKAGDGSASPFRNCTLSFVTASYELVALAGVCILESEAECDAVLGSLAFDPGEHLPFDAALPGAAPKSTKALDLGSAHVKVPSDWQAATDEQTKRRTEAIVTANPRMTAEVAEAHTPPGQPGAIVTVRRTSAAAPPGASSATVRQVLEAEIEGRRRGLASPGIELVSFDATPKDDAVEFCDVSRKKEEGGTLENRACGVMFITPDGRGTVIEVLCLAEASAAASICKPILDSRVFDAEKRLRLEDKAPVTPTK